MKYVKLFEEFTPSEFSPENEIKEEGSILEVKVKYSNPDGDFTIHFVSPGQSSTERMGNFLNEYNQLFQTDYTTDEIASVQDISKIENEDDYISDFSIEASESQEYISPEFISTLTSDPKEEQGDEEYVPVEESFWVWLGNPVMLTSFFESVIGQGWASELRSYIEETDIVTQDSLADSRPDYYVMISELLNSSDDRMN
jgi:hypothetical protein